MAKAQQLRDRYGPWAVVTGASDGIGRAFAHQLADAGLSLVLAARRGQHLARLAGELELTHGIATKIVATDLSRLEATDELARAAAGHDVGLLVAAAGYGTSGPLLHGELADELEMVDLNCRAVLAQCHTFGRRFAQRGSGGIVLLSSIVGYQGVPRAANYAATKAYVQSLGEALRSELSPLGVDVLCCAPGPVNSGFGSRADMKLSATVSPDPVARAALAALGRRTTVAPGARSKLLTSALRTLPRPGRTRVMAYVMNTMTAHQTQPAQPPPDRA